MNHTTTGGGRRFGGAAVAFLSGPVLQRGRVPALELHIPEAIHAPPHGIPRPRKFLRVRIVRTHSGRRSEGSRARHRGALGGMPARHEVAPVLLVGELLPHIVSSWPRHACPRKPLVLLRHGVRGPPDVGVLDMIFQKIRPGAWNSSPRKPLVSVRHCILGAVIAILADVVSAGAGPVVIEPDRQVNGDGRDGRLRQHELVVEPVRPWPRIILIVINMRHCGTMW